MIAKTYGILLFFLTSSYVSAFNYIELAAKYNVNPPELAHGFPYQFLDNHKSVKAVIYLTDAIEDYEKYGDNVYVTRPDSNNAAVIREFSLDYTKVFSEERQIAATYVIIPDSTISTKDLDDFLSELMKGMSGITFEFLFFDAKGKYFAALKTSPVHYDPSIIFCGIRQSLDLMANSRFQLRFENENCRLVDLSNEISSYLTSNIFNDVNYNMPPYNMIDKEEIKRKIDQFEICLNKEKDTSIIEWIKLDLDRYKYYRKLYLKLKTDIHIPYNYIFEFKFQRITMTNLYKVFGEINLGFFKARDYYAKESFNIPYEVLLGEGRNGKYADHLDFISLTIPNNVFINEFKNERALYPEVIPIPFP